MRPPYFLIKRVNEYYKQDRQMTYIIAGKLENKPFLMIDCVGIDSTNPEQARYNFVNKTSKFKSLKNTFYTFTGCDRFSHAIDLVDTKYHLNNETFDYKDKTFINEVMKMYELLVGEPCDLKTGNWKGFNRIYVIDNTTVFYHTIMVSNNLKTRLIDSIELKDNTIVLPDDAGNIPVPIDTDLFKNDSLYDDCKTELKKSINYGIDLKDRFSFISFTGDKVDYISPNTDRELALSFTGKDYNKI